MAVLNYSVVCFYTIYIVFNGKDIPINNNSY